MVPPVAAPLAPAVATAPAAGAVVPAAGAMGITPVVQSAPGPPNADAMQPPPMAEASVPQVFVAVTQHDCNITGKPGIGAGGGQFFFSGGGVHPAAVTYPHVCVAATQHGVASTALGMSVISSGRKGPAGLVQVVAPHATDVGAPAPLAPAVPVPAVATVPAAATEPAAVGGGSPGGGLLLQPPKKAVIRQAAIHHSTVILMLLCSLGLECALRAQRTPTTNAELNGAR